MRRFVGIVIIAFWLGYLSATCDLFELLAQIKPVIYIVCTIGCIYLSILIPLERIAVHEAEQRPKTSFRTSAQEHLKRRGSF
ncbi:hypothetical protein DM01DRAFT_1200160 [Hesseltinella vesiculosa]|uniref:Uncharacterized protein n=1 Tax=Hesseltinella vesiculosa TaxID=101127 RepID=A0A1X2G358_9FUNG|nr:hypothetical protein DM01DRAFT_1200160 [Hesseltinella vesiculosa]